MAVPAISCSSRKLTFVLAVLLFSTALLCLRLDILHRVLDRPAQPSIRHESLNESRQAFLFPGPRWESIEPWLFIYSAIIHYQYQKVVIIAMAPEKRIKASLIKCDLSYSQSEDLQGPFDIVPEEMWQAADQFGRAGEYKGYLLICASPVNDSVVPRKVSVYVKKTHPTVTWIPVTHNPRKSTTKSSIVVCMKPFHHTYNKPWRIQEFIELQHLQGVSAFQLYVHSASQKVKNLLRKYQLEQRPGLKVNVLEWPLPLQTELHFSNTIDNPVPGNVVSHNYGQYPAMYDCWLRNVRLHKFVTFLDIDEMPILYQHNSFQQLFHDKVGSDYFMFRHVYFPMTVSDDEKANKAALRTRAVSLLKHTRIDNIFDPFDRSRYFVRLDALHSPGIHLVFRLRGRVGVLRPHVISPDLGLLHHYRDEVPVDTYTYKEDTRAYRFSEKLVHVILSARERGLVWWTWY